jgi:hypothetical protein
LLEEALRNPQQLKPRAEIREHKTEEIREENAPKPGHVKIHSKRVEKM